MSESGVEKKFWELDEARLALVEYIESLEEDEPRMPQGKDTSLFAKMLGRDA